MAVSDVNAAGSADVAQPPQMQANSITSNPYGVGNYGSSTNALNYTTNDTGATSGSSSSGSTGTSSGFDWGSILSGLGSIASNPLVSSSALIGLGEYEASQAQSQTAGLTSQITKPASQFVQGGTSELQQTLQGLQGQPVTSGSIGQQETAAQNLGNIATQYTTGQLTDAQKQQVQQQIQSQQQNIRQQLANQGITDASVIAMYDQQIQNNATQLTQQLTQQNLTIGQNALTSVQQTYSNLLNQSISQFGAGMGPIEDAVNLTVQQNTQIANGLQQLFGNIAKGFSGAGGTGGGGSSGTSASSLNSLVNQISKLFSGSSSGSSLSSIGIQPAGATSSITGADLSSMSGIYGDSALTSGTDVAATTGVTPAFDTGFMGTGSNIAGDMNFADATGGFSSAGGGAAAGGTAGGAADAAGTAAAGEAGAGSSGAAAGSLAGGAAGVAIAAAPAIAGMMTSGVQVDASYWSGIQNTLQQNAPQQVNGQWVYPGATPQQQAQSQALYSGAVNELMGDIGVSSGTGLSSNAGNTPAPSQLVQYASNLYNPITGQIGIEGWGALASQSVASGQGGTGGGLGTHVSSY